MKSNGRVNGKTPEIWKVKGKALDTNTGGSPGCLSQPNSLEKSLIVRM